MASLRDESVDSMHGRLYGSTHPPPSKLRRLPEIISHIISFVIPNSGLTISNDPDCNSHFDTIISLLKTSIKTKNETLRQIYRQPLHICITSESTSWFRNVSQSLLGRAASLPLSNWPVLNIPFTPVPGSPCLHTAPWDFISVAREDHLFQMEAVYNCVVLLSEMLARHLKQQYAAHESNATLKIAFTFAEVWVDRMDNSQQQQGFFNIGTVFDLMRPWGWTAATTEALTGQISFPPMMFTGHYYSYHDSPDGREASRSRSFVEDLERQFSASWSPRVQLPLYTPLSRLNFDPTNWRWTRHPGIFANELNNACGLLCIKITPDTTAGNGLGIWEPAILQREP